MENKEIFSKSALKALIIPLLVEQVLAVTVGLSDVMMVSNVGEAAISGVSLVDMINNLMIAIFAALATGGAVVTAQCIGARHYEEARKSAKQLIIVAITLSIVIMVGCLIFNRHILRVLFGSIDNDVMHNAMLYFLISSASYPFLALYNSCAALFRSIAATNLETKDGIATPSTPILNTKIKMALPHIFMTFISIETFIDMAELPIDLKRAAQEL